MTRFIAVGAIEMYKSGSSFQYRSAAYSNSGASMDFAAPGGNISVDANEDGCADFLVIITPLTEQDLC